MQGLRAQGQKNGGNPTGVIITAQTVQRESVRAFVLREENSTMNEKDAFDIWAIVEIMGHTKLAGRASEQTIAGSTFLRVDVPGVDGQESFTRFYGAGAIYSITPCTEEIARRAAEALRERPITVFGVVLPERELIAAGSVGVRKDPDDEGWDEDEMGDWHEGDEIRF
jgi:hypothetical protein